MKIGITDCLREDKLRKYMDWIHSVDPETDLAVLSPGQGIGDDLDGMQGLLLTGGGDVDPALYGRAALHGLTRDVNAGRDEFELGIIRRALKSDLPILGVCRGMQVMNVALGGTLHGDLKTDGYREHSSSNGAVLMHPIAIEPNSLLSGLAGGTDQMVNSYHHQAVDDLGNGLMPVAVSEDGVVEAAEWSLKEGMPFLLLVQWHPERTSDRNDVFSQNLARIFLREVHYATANKATH